MIISRVGMRAKCDIERSVRHNLPRTLQLPECVECDDAIDVAGAIARHGCRNLHRPAQHLVTIH